MSSPEQLCELFSQFRPRMATASLHDFSRLHKGARVFCEVAPASVEEAAAVVALAARHGIPLRTRGAGHALNGSSLPRASDLVIRTSALTRLQPHPDSTIDVGAGVVVWALDEWLRERGWALPVVNDGYAGPSVGGYVAAGGFGPASRTAGGFWNHVFDLTVIDGYGRVQKWTPEDPVFPWLFGAMGQLGLVVQARLGVVARPESAPLSGAPAKIPLPGRDAQDRRLEEESGRLFWFTLFVPETARADASARLDALEKEHCSTFAFRNRYVYLIAHHHIVAPLVWPHACDCYAVGSWGIVEDASQSAIDKVLAFDARFTELALERDFRRYVQSEIPSGPQFYARYFSAKTLAALRTLKRELDPHNLFNRDWIFG